MKKNRFVIFLAGMILCAGMAYAASSTDLIKDIDIPFKKFTLDNGLTLIVHEDHKAPIVAVNVWYHVGSKNEKEGKTGFAHLFEHLMFNGSEHFDDDYFKMLEPVGATDLNGTTSNDRTNYFQNVPTSAFDLVLWMESDRMGHLLGAISQGKLDEQRGVVQNEKRQGENQPYGKVYDIITTNTFPKGHPYSWTVIGSMEDLNAASLDDVKEWFKEYYGAANAVLSIAGDVNADEVKAKVEKYFGDIPSGPPLTKQEAWVAKRTGTHRQITYDRVPQARVYMVWNVPQEGTETGVYLNLVSDVLSTGKTSRLYKRLVYDDQIATNANAYIDSMEVAGQFYIEATARPGEDLKKVEKAVQEELDKFLKDGPTEKELERVKTQSIAGFVKGIERIGGFGGKSDILASNQVYNGDPAFYKENLVRIQNATVKDLHEAAKEWLSDGAYILSVCPFPEYATTEVSVDRSTLPVAGEAPEARFPDFKRQKLANGLELIVAERHTTPVVQFQLLLDAGYASDQFAAPGVAALAMNMLDEGTEKLDALEISDELQMLGASIGSGSNLDVSSVSLNTLKATMDDALKIYSDVILNPAFPQKELDRLKKEQLASIKREKVTPVPMALRVFPKLLYGEGHAYSNPFSGSGTEQAVSAITVDDLKKFHQTWFKPNHATLIVAGDTTLSEIAPKIESAFKKWEAGDTPKKNIGEVKLPEKTTVYLIDRPGSQQSFIIAGEIAPPKANPHEIAIETMNYTLGGAFTSRINMNLREDKHWSYGAGATVIDARGQRPYIAYSNVQMDKTKESIQEVVKEFTAIASDKPVTDDELMRAKQSKTLELPGSWETIGAVGGSISDIVQFGLPDDYYQTYSGKIRALTGQDVAEAAKIVVHPNQLTWVVVGDRSKIEASLKELGFEIKSIDVDGKTVQ